MRARDRGGSDHGLGRLRRRLAAPAASFRHRGDLAVRPLLRRRTAGGRDRPGRDGARGVAPLGRCEPAGRGPDPPGSGPPINGAGAVGGRRGGEQAAARSRLRRQRDRDVELGRRSPLLAEGCPRQGVRCGPVATRGNRRGGRRRHLRLRGRGGRGLDRGRRGASLGPASGRPVRCAGEARLPRSPLDRRRDRERAAGGGRRPRQRLRDLERERVRGHGHLGPEQPARFRRRRDPAAERAVRSRGAGLQRRVPIEICFPGPPAIAAGEDDAAVAWQARTLSNSSISYLGAAGFRAPITGRVPAQFDATPPQIAVDAKGTWSWCGRRMRS